MAREGLRSHLSGSVPISIGLHLAGLLVILIIPLTAEVILPPPAMSAPDYVRVAPMPPPPDVVIRTPPRASAPAPLARVEVPPTSAPASITREGEPPRALDTVLSPGPSTGLPSGFNAGPGAVSSIAVPLPEPPRSAGPVRVADLPVAPRKTVDVRPVYPEIARAVRVQGTVVVEAVLDPSGRVTQLRVLQSVPMLDQAALDAVRQWRYTPSLYGGHPVSVLMTITIRFSLQ